MLDVASCYERVGRLREGVGFSKARLLGCDRLFTPTTPTLRVLEEIATALHEKLRTFTEPYLPDTFEYSHVAKVACV